MNDSLRREDRMLASSNPPHVVPVGAHPEPTPGNALRSFGRRNLWTLIGAGLIVLAFLFDHYVQDIFDPNAASIISLLLLFTGFHLDQRHQTAEAVEEIRRSLHAPLTDLHHRL